MKYWCRVQDLVGVVRMAKPDRTLVRITKNVLLLKNIIFLQGSGKTWTIRAAIDRLRKKSSGNNGSPGSNGISGSFDYEICEVTLATYSGPELFGWEDENGKYNFGLVFFAFLFCLFLAVFFAFLLLLLCFGVWGSFFLPRVLMGPYFTSAHRACVNRYL